MLDEHAAQRGRTYANVGGVLTRDLLADCLAKFHTDGVSGNE